MIAVERVGRKSHECISNYLLSVLWDLGRKPDDPDKRIGGRLFHSSGFSPFTELVVSLNHSRYVQIRSAKSARSAPARRSASRRRGKKRNTRFLLKLRIPRKPRERNHIADVGHAGNKQDQSLKAQTKATVWCRAEFAQLQVPP